MFFFRPNILFCTIAQTKLRREKKEYFPIFASIYSVALAITSWVELFFHFTNPNFVFTCLFRCCFLYLHNCGRRLFFPRLPAYWIRIESKKAQSWCWNMYTWPSVGIFHLFLSLPVYNAHCLLMMFGSHSAQNTAYTPNAHQDYKVALILLFFLTLSLCWFSENPQW